MAPKSNFEVERDMLEVLEAAYTEEGRAGLGRSEGEPNIEREAPNPRMFSPMCVCPSFFFPRISQICCEYDVDPI